MQRTIGCQLTFLRLLDACPNGPTDASGLVGSVGTLRDALG